MKKQFTMILRSMFLLASFNSCSKIDINSPIVEEDRTLSTFSQITSKIAGDVILVQDNNQKVTVQAQENIIDDLITEVTGGHLNIYMNNRPKITGGKHFKVYISVPKIDKLVLEGSGNIEAQNEISTNDNLDLVLKGSGNIELQSLACKEVNAELSGSGKLNIYGGNANQIHSKLKGSGNFNAAHFTVNEAWINLSGSGNATLRITDYLDAKLTGSGNIYYYGNPRVKKNITGSGRVEPKN